ncbi:glycosyltransferase [Puia dinghuensis]|uniref:Glycosyltransferase 2-like domain-containing protein n=1 Tax=Puia dinghuensis TaxID=1792502 RepID=A0A8J2U9F0_9BACT|nr:glycosyltransferase [Puia dinghuensis]GGA88581.1 hypothetical protein GCM10011511_09770 [Puia dinghuensis]
MISQTQQPFLSCIMPTYNRREFVPHAIRYFLRQGYEAKELIIIDDGEDPVTDLVPEAENIRYYRFPRKMTLGAKLNLACGYARGDIIAHWDDDDWYAVRRLQYQVESLLHAQTDICGINRLLYYDLRHHRAHQYVYPSDQRVWLIGSSLCYRKKFWEAHRFADIDVGMDGLFVWSTTADRITVLPDVSISVHMIHDRNVSPKKTEGPWWHPHPVEEIQHIMKEDWAYYHAGGQAESAESGAAPVSVPAVAGGQALAPGRAPAPGWAPLKNIYACLVHEKREAVIDLVRNLHHHDPDSLILLYNGGEDQRLLQDHSLLGSYGAHIYPNPVPMKWGYLHSFALRCMEFALANFTFDTLTIVDSDQLAVRSGYSHFLGQSLPSRAGIGMLSSQCSRVAREDNSNKIAAQAWREYGLWKPLLDSFPNGENAFVHWTFWPSTVFMADAIRDLTRVFRENKLLQQTVQRSTIWASEEVILPTVVRLLGYTIANNPCSYEYVRYRQPMTLEDVRCATGKSTVYWMHPVARQFEDPLRADIRKRAKGYTGTPSRIVPLITRMHKTAGWLSDEEEGVLSGVTLKACKETEDIHHIVEIGCCRDKSTVLFGGLIKTFCLQAMVHSIDVHDGRVGLAVDWQQPISLLFIDGLHDYVSLLRDFPLFSPWMRPGAYAAFHDYADYSPGVQAFVNELLASGVYHKVYLTGSLIILQKCREQDTTH